jgi:hypothetical protein
MSMPVQKARSPAPVTITQTTRVGLHLRPEGMQLARHRQIEGVVRSVGSASA